MNAERVRQVAKQLWEHAGKPAGLDTFMWEVAEEMLKMKAEIRRLREQVDDEQRRGFLKGLGVLPSG